MPRVLHLLSQRPGRTGSGVTLEHLVRIAAGRGYEQEVLVGVPAEEPPLSVGGLDPSCVHRVSFGRPPLDFAVPGMSDVMPYASTVFSSMAPARFAAYRAAFHSAIASRVRSFRPDWIHSHHVWLMSSLVKDAAPSTKVVVHCHATGLRQLGRCPAVADEIRLGNSRNDAFVVLHRGHRQALTEALHVPPERVHVVGSGFAEELFTLPERAVTPRPSHLCYAGKFSRAKGLPWLLDACEPLAAQDPEFRLHIAGSSDADEESRALEARMRGLPFVELHGRLDQPALATLFQRCPVFVLPSFYEGVPLVVLEAVACGARVVVTALPGVIDQLATPLASRLHLLQLPTLVDADRPDPQELSGFVEALRASLRAALEHSRSAAPSSMRASIGQSLAPFTWSAVFDRVERVWKGLLPEVHR